MKLSTQAMASLMFCLQNSILHQTDIIPALADLEFENTEGYGLVVTNPPTTELPDLEEEDGSVGEQLELFKEYNK